MNEPYREFNLNRGHVWSTFTGFVAGIALGLASFCIAACGPPEPSTGTVDLEVEEVEAGPILESPDTVTEAEIEEVTEPAIEELITEPEPEE